VTVVLGAGGVVILEHPFRGVVLVVHRSPFELRLPKGMVDQGETLRETAHREVLEETGLSGEIGDLIGVAKWDQVYEGLEYTKEVSYFFVNDPTWIETEPDLDVRGLVLVSVDVADELLSFQAERGILRQALGKAST
jgi:8-oxo-dGTP diphosphatase